MKQLIRDIVGFLTSLDPIDILLYFAVVVLIVLVVSLIYIIKTSDDDEEIEVEDYSKPTAYNKEELDLQDVMTNLEKVSPPSNDTSSYEIEQEEKAIISYEELLKKNKCGSINYDEEKRENEEISIKKINLDQFATPIKEEKTPTNSLFNYEKEEAFLKAIQALNNLLN